MKIKRVNVMVWDGVEVNRKLVIRRLELVGGEKLRG
jgi:hypothetical protein